MDRLETVESGRELEVAVSILEKRTIEFDSPPDKTIMDDKPENYEMSDAEAAALEYLHNAGGGYLTEKWNSKLGRLDCLETRLGKAREILIKLREAGEILKDDEVCGKVIEVLTEKHDIMIGGGYLFQAAREVPNPEFGKQKSDIDILIKCTPRKLRNIALSFYGNLEGFEMSYDDWQINIEKDGKQVIGIHCVEKMTEHVDVMLEKLGMESAEDDEFGRVLRHREAFEGLGQMGIVIKAGSREVQIARAGACVESAWWLAENPNSLTVFNPRVMAEIKEMMPILDETWRKVLEKGVEMEMSLVRRLGRTGRTLFEDEENMHPARVFLGEIMNDPRLMVGKPREIYNKDLTVAIADANPEDLFSTMLEIPTWVAIGGRNLFEALGYELKPNTVGWRDDLKDNEELRRKLVDKFDNLKTQKCSDVTEVFAQIAKLAKVNGYVEPEKLYEGLKVFGVERERFIALVGVRGVE